MTTLTFSQGIVNHSTNTGQPSGAQNFLVINGNKVDLSAPFDQPFVAAIAHRDTNYLITLQSGSDIEAWGYGTSLEFNQAMDNTNGGGPSSNLWYLYIEIDRITGQLSYGHSIYEHSSGSAPPYSAAQRPDDLHWFDTTENVMKVWRASGIAPNYGRWVEVIRLFVAKYAFGASFASVSINSPSFIGTTTGLTGSFKAGALVFDVIGNPLIRTSPDNNSIFFTTEDVFITGMPSTASPVSGNRARYETFLVDALGQTPAPSYSMVQFDDFNEVTPLIAGNEGNKLWGMIEFPIGASGDLVQVTMSGVVRNPSWNWKSVGKQIFVHKSQPGILTTDSTKAFPNQLPVGVVIDRTSILLRRPELALVTTPGSIVNHDNLVNNGGSDSHTTITAHMNDSDIHFTKDSVNLEDLGNVASGSPTAIGGTVLTWVGSPGKWIPQTPASGVTDHTLLSNIGTNTHVQIDTHIADSTIHFTASSVNLEDLGNVASGSPTATGGNVLTWVGSPGRWIPQDINLSLEDLSNTSGGSPTATTGDVLTWDGSQWEPQDINLSLEDLSNTSEGSPTATTGDVLTWDGSQWEPQPTQPPSSFQFPYDLAYYISDTPSISVTIGAILIPRSVTITSGSPTESRAHAETPVGSSETTFDIAINGGSPSMGTIVFAVGNSEGTIEIPNDISLNPGDRLKIISRSTVDSSIAGISITIIGCTLISQCSI